MSIAFDHQELYVKALREQLALAERGDRAEAFVRYAERLLRNGVPVLFDRGHLAHVLGIGENTLADLLRKPERNYTSFRIAKSRGGSRLIEAPSTLLKHVQRTIQTSITSQLPVNDCAHGFRPRHSIASNAAPHVGSSFILKLDLQDFFGTVGIASVRSSFRGLGYSRSVADALAGLCTLRDVLPQGAPTSPDLANAAAAKLDAALAHFAAERGLAYTRYADDLTFSGAGVERRSVQRGVETIVAGFDFTVNASKTARLSRATQQRVTGVVVNEKLNWPRDRRRWLRQEVHHLERHGVESHLRWRAKRHPEYQRAGYKDFLYGHVYALNCVRPDEAAPLLARLDRIEWPF